MSADHERSRAANAANAANIANAASRIWAMLGTLDSSNIECRRPVRPGVYDEDYPHPLTTGVWDIDGVPHFTYHLNLRAHYGTKDSRGRVEVAYCPQMGIWPEERGVLQGVTATNFFAFQYHFAESVWRIHPRMGPTETQPVAVADVNAAFGCLVSDMVEEDGSSAFDLQILDAVGALPLPIAEQVAWHLAPPSLEDCLLRRGQTDP